MTVIRVLLISNDGPTTENRRTLVAAPDVAFVGQYTTVPSAKRHLAQDPPDVVLLDLRVDDSLPLLEWMAEVAPETAPIVLLTAEQMGQLQKAMLAGARTFCMVPATTEELLVTVREVHDGEVRRRERQRAGGPSSGAETADHGRIIVVTSLKGGVGRSVIAVNLAVALAEECGEQVALVEGYASLGDVSLMLNLQPAHTLVELASDPSRLDADLIRMGLQRHASKVGVLFGARDMDGAKLLTPQLVAAALRHLRRIAAYIVVDTSSEAADMLAEVLAAADVVLVVTTPELPSLRRAVALLQDARQVGGPSEKLRLVLNREGLSGGLNNADITQRLGLPIALALPDDPALVAYSINRGIPLVISHRKSALCRRLREFAGQLSHTSHAEAGVSETHSVGRRSQARLAGLLQRVETLG
ncbi:MAG TPA: P-loop NTPase [Anaerolineae bacterium]|nr:P-loop NTPase [Anaerolineae bacterium]